MKYLKKGIDVILAVYLLFLAALSVPSWFGYRLYVVLSPSMEPGIRAGSAVYVRQEPFEDIREGDVITFPMGDGSACVTHRVVGKNEAEQTFATKGDANTQQDARETAYEDVIGTVKLTVPFLGYAAVLMESMEEKIMLLGLLVWLIFAQALLAGLLRMQQEGVDFL